MSETVKQVKGNGKVVAKPKVDPEQVVDENNKPINLDLFEGGFDEEGYSFVLQKGGLKPNVSDGSAGAALFGYDNRSEGYGNFAAGTNNIVKGSRCNTLGRGNITYGNYATCIGRANGANTGGIALGMYANAIGENSFAFSNVLTKGTITGSEVNYNIKSLKMLSYGKSIFNINFCIVVNTVASRVISLEKVSETEFNVVLERSLGTLNNATCYVGGGMALGNRSIALGGIALGDNSIAIGELSYTYNNYEIAIGVNNSTKSDDISRATHFSVGNNGQNILEAKKNNDLYIIGIGGYNGKNPDEAKSLQEVIAELQSNNNNG